MICFACGASMQPWIDMPIDAKKDAPTAYGAVARCTGCGLGQANPLPARNDVATFYDLDAYYTHGQSHMRPVRAGLFDRILVRLAWQADSARPFDIDAICTLLPAGSTVLDIGCGDGELLELLRDAGYTAMGIDPDAESRAAAARKGLMVFSGTAEQPPKELRGCRFDLVVMSHSLEHCLDPAAALRTVRAFLTPRGLAYVEVPNAGCRHFETFRHCSEMFDAPRHLWFFTADALSRSAAAAGLVMVRWHYNGFTRLFSRSWREWECEIYERLRKRGLAIGARRHSLPRSLRLLALSAFAPPLRKYDSIGILARAAPQPIMDDAPVAGVGDRAGQRRRGVRAAAAAGLAFAVAAAPLAGGIDRNAVANARGIALDATTARLATPALLPAFPPRGLSRADVARLINARKQIAPGQLFVAEPLTLPASLTDWQRAVDCLAAATYYEAGNGALDQRAVAQVVLNRLRHNAFPKTICGVVFEGSARSTGCQFTFTCDGAMRRRPSPAEWNRARQVAAGMLSGQVEPAVGQSTHYHTNWVAPAWNREMDKISAIKTHLFFRWRGKRGAPSAFRATYRGAEPRIANLGMLSPVHRDAAGYPPISYAPTVPFDVADAPSLPPPLPNAAVGERLADKASDPGPDVFLVTLPHGLAANGIADLARSRCKGLAQCRFIAWSDPARAASQLPIAGSAIDAISFTFVRQGGAEPDRIQWNCREFPRSDRSQCLQRGG